MKKITIDHVGPFWWVFVLITLLTLSLLHFPIIVLSVVGVMLAPYVITKVWNTFIATQDDYYE